MPVYLKKNKLLSNKIIKQNNTINKNILSNYINTKTSNRLFGKNSLTDRSVYLSQNPYNIPGGFIRNPNCWINGVSNISCFSPAQLSGAPWNTRGGTLLTKKHVLFAKHYVTSIISGGTPLIFVDENSNAIQRKIIQYAYDDTDIAIALLDNEVPETIKIAKILPKNFTDYINCSISTTNGDFEAVGDILLNPLLYCVALDQQEKAIIKICFNFGQKYLSGGFGGNSSPWIYMSAFNPDGISSSYLDNMYPNPTIFSSFSEDIVTGDSGNPIFLIIDNELVVLASWHTPWGGPFITSRYDQVNAIIENLSPNQGYSLTPIDLASVYAKYS